MLKAQNIQGAVAFKASVKNNTTSGLHLNMQGYKHEKIKSVALKSEIHQTVCGCV